MFFFRQLYRLVAESILQTVELSFHCLVLCFLINKLLFQVGDKLSSFSRACILLCLVCALCRLEQAGELV